MGSRHRTPTGRRGRSSAGSAQGELDSADGEQMMEAVKREYIAGEPITDAGPVGQLDCTGRVSTRRVDPHWRVHPHFTRTTTILSDTGASCNLATHPVAIVSGKGKCGGASAHTAAERGHVRSARSTLRRGRRTPR